MTPAPGDRIRVGVSACLLGLAVRWDGGHKRNQAVADHLARRFELVPVCPEEELGLGVPREPLDLEGEPDAPRLVFRSTRRDLTARMRAFSEERVDRLRALGVAGFILKRASPSCGVERVPVRRPGPLGATAPPGAPEPPGTLEGPNAQEPQGAPAPDNAIEPRAAGEGTGLFARALMDRLPLLPVEEESGLEDPRRRASFIERVLEYHRNHVGA